MTVEVIAEFIDFGWMTYRANQGFYEEAEIGQLQKISDQGAIIPYFGVFGNGSGIILDIAEIFMGIEPNY